MRQRKKTVGSVRLVSRSPAETRRLGKKIGGFLESGDVVTLEGELGAGKTTLAKGIAEGLGADVREVVSPTFVLINEYEGRKKIFHVDWYRIDRIEGRDRELALECFGAEAVTLVEWPGRGREILPAGALRVKIEHSNPAGPGAPDRRILRLSAPRTARFAPLFEVLAKRIRA